MVKLVEIKTAETPDGRRGYIYQIHKCALSGQREAWGGNGHENLGHSSHRLRMLSMKINEPLSQRCACNKKDRMTFRSYKICQANPHLAEPEAAAEFANRASLHKLWRFL